DGAEDFGATIARASDVFAPVTTAADDPAMMIYTSGTTGPPKGALEPHRVLTPGPPRGALEPHRVLLGHLPGVEYVHEFFPQVGDRMWTPADWAWAGGAFTIFF